MNDKYGTYSRILLNFRCQTYDVSGKRGVPKMKLLSANFQIQRCSKNKTKCLVLLVFSDGESLIEMYFFEKAIQHLSVLH